MSEGSIEHRLANGRLHRLDRGVYAVGRRELGREGRWMVAVLGCGPAAALSHSSAAALWGFGRERAGLIEVSVPVASARQRDGVEVHRRRRLRSGDVVEHRGIPVTTPVRTLIDQATRLDEPALERAVNEADRLDLVDPITLLGALAAYPGQHGVGPLRALLGNRVFRLTDSELEQRFLHVVRRARLPLPLTQQRVSGHRVDFFWPGLGLVVETDGLRYHRTPAQQARDLRRDQAHTAAGLAHLRFTHAQVRYEAADVEATLVTTVRKLQRRAAGELQPGTGAA